MNSKTKRVTTIGMLCAITYATMVVGRIPIILFLKYDPSDVIVTLGGFIWGPMTSCIVSVIVAILEMITVSDTGILGCIMNIVQTLSFACTASVIYKKKHTLSGAVIGLASGWLITVVVMLLWNYLVTPLYMGYPREAVVELLLPAFLPFNLLKGGLNASITFLLYKPIVTALRKSGYVAASENEARQKHTGGKFYYCNLCFDYPVNEWDYMRIEMKEKLNEPIYTLTGTVIHGRGIGKHVGTPTANIAIEKKDFLPKTGVYVADILLGDKRYYGVTHIGTRPTLDNDSFVSIETYIFDFDKDIYGCTITVNLYKKLREVRKFNELSLLLEQIANDRTMAQEFWGLKQTNHTLHIDVNRHCVILEQQEVYLSTNEFEVLYLLLQSPQTAFTKEQIYEQIWHEPTNNHLHAVENTIFQIRKRLKPYCMGHEYIKTVIGYGYKFNSE